MPRKPRDKSLKGWGRNHFREPAKPAGNKPGVDLPPTMRRQRRQEAVMNHSIHSADRATHLKIVVVALVAGITVAGLAISARTGSDASQTARVIKAGKPVTVTSSNTSMVR